MNNNLKYEHDDFIQNSVGDEFLLTSCLYPENPHF